MSIETNYQIARITKMYFSDTYDSQTFFPSGNILKFSNTNNNSSKRYYCDMEIYMKLIANRIPIQCLDGFKP